MNKNYDAKIIVSDNQVTFSGFEINKNYMKIYIENERLYVCGSTNSYNIPNSVFISLKNATTGVPCVIMMYNQLNSFFASIPIKEFYLFKLPVGQCYESVDRINLNNLPENIAKDYFRNEALDLYNRYTEVVSPEFLSDCKIDPKTDVLKFVYVPGGISGEIFPIAQIPNNIYIALFAPYFGADKYVKSVTNIIGLRGIQVDTFIDSMQHLAKLLPYVKELSLEINAIYSEFITNAAAIISKKEPGIIYIGR